MVAITRMVDSESSLANCLFYIVFVFVFLDKLCVVYLLEELFK